MPSPKPKPSNTQQRQGALAKWEDEGGHGPNGPLKAIHLLGAKASLPPIGEAEMLALHIRVVALENLVIALLATASDSQREIARTMAEYISPRPGATPHPLTTLAAGHITNLVERAVRFGARPAEPA